MAALFTGDLQLFYKITSLIRLNNRMVLHIRENDPQPRQIQTVVDVLQSGGVIIYPTDTIYGLGCDIFQQKAIERVCGIKKVDPSTA